MLVNRHGPAWKSREPQTDLAAGGQRGWGRGRSSKMSSCKVSRRWLAMGGLAVLATGCASQTGRTYSLDPRFNRQRVKYETGSEKAGTIVVDTSQRFLFAVEEDG